MPITISIGSGKGGTGKSLAASNIAALLSKMGKDVYLIDLDIGGADAHILYGLFKPEKTLTDFLDGNIKELSEVSIILKPFYDLKLIVGTGETLKTANMPYATKMRLLRNIQKLKADFIIIDVGAGTGLNTLDFFISTDFQVCVSTLDPTSILDFYRFLKLAAIRKVLSSFLSTDEVSKAIAQRSFNNIGDLLNFAESIRKDAREAAEKAIEQFNPLLILNQVRGEYSLDRTKLRHVVKKFLGIELPELGIIPWDDTVHKALRSYMPVVEFAPNSKVTSAIQGVCKNLVTIVEKKKK